MRSLFPSIYRGLIIAILTLTFSVALALPSPAGNWTTIDDQSQKPKSTVNLYISNGKLYGKITKLYKENIPEKGDTCTKCKGALKDQPLIGLPIVQGLTQEKDGSWSGGTITDPKTGKTYKCTMTLSADGKTLKVRGYVGVSLLGRTQTWQKAN
jgi:uncharacterized protein (DUF2147 family)